MLLNYIYWLVFHSFHILSCIIARCTGSLQQLPKCLMSCLFPSHQDFCTPSSPTWPPEGALRTYLGPLSLSCVSVCRRSGLVCEPALFHHLNNPKTFSR